MIPNKRIRNPKIKQLYDAIHYNDALYTDDSEFIDKNIAPIPAAILMAITDQDEPTVILTQRPEWLRSHGGQVSFPGGKIDPNDESAMHAALREAHEELSINPDYVDVIAVCKEYGTGSGYNITPVIGIIPPNLEILASPDEVESWFEVPLSFLMDRSNAEYKTTFWNGRERSYYDIYWQDRRIWGVTAGIIINLARQFEHYRLNYAPQ